MSEEYLRKYREVVSYYETALNRLLDDIEEGKSSISHVSIVLHGLLMMSSGSLDNEARGED